MTSPPLARARRRGWRRPRLLSEPWRQWIAGIVSYVAYAAVMGPGGIAGWGEYALAGSLFIWDVYAAVYLALTAVLFQRSDSAAVAARIAEHRLPRSRLRRWLSGRQSVRAIVTFTSFYALLSAAWALPRRNDLLPGAPLVLAVIAVLAVALAWLLAHVQFAQHYTLRYYDAAADRPLEFPGRTEPDYWDFSYFSIAVATTFGTTDVAVATAAMRRAVLGHAVSRSPTTP